MTLDISRYKTLVFDCDGVILNSNHIKTSAFYNAALPYGEAYAKELVKYHVNHGGVSRYAKFDYFLKNIVPKDVLKNIPLETHHTELLNKYAQFVKQGLIECEVATGIEKLRQVTSNTKWLIVSGGDQKELNEIFELRNLKSLFDGGIFGSPDTKDKILDREIKNKNITQPALFLGDSKYDYQAANQAGLNFIFLSGWSEVVNWREWISTNSINHTKYLNNLNFFSV